MTNQHPPGRRRADDGSGVNRAAPATHAALARLWQRVSRAQEVLDQRRRYFEATADDTRLSDQLSLLPMLHEWLPVAATEAADLSHVLDLYVDPARAATRTEIARELTASIRRMAVRRAKSGIPHPDGDDARSSAPPPVPGPTIPRQRIGGEVPRLRPVGPESPARPTGSSTRRPDPARRASRRDARQARSGARSEPRVHARPPGAGSALAALVVAVVALCVSVVALVLAAR